MLLIKQRYGISVAASIMRLHVLHIITEEEKQNLYKADFVFRNEANEIIKVVDVKGMVLPEFKMKAKLFANRYGIPITIAKKVARINMFEESEI